MDNANENNERDILQDFLTFFLLTVLLCSLSFIQGIIGGVASLFVMVPPTLFYLNHKKTALSFAMIVLAAAALPLLTFAGILSGMGTQSSFYYLYQFGALNVFLILVLGSESDFIRIVFRTSLFTYFVILAVTGSLATAYGVSVHEVVTGVIDSNIDAITEMYSKVKFNADQLEFIKVFYNELRELLKNIYPALIFITFEMFVVFNLFVSNRLVSKGEKKIDTSNLINWTPNENLVWGVILFGFLEFMKNDGAKFVAQNGLVIFLSVYFFFGICILNYFFKTKKVPVFIQSIIYFSLILISVAKYFVIGLGIFDIWFDFRKIKKSHVR